MTVVVLVAIVAVLAASACLYGSVAMPLLLLLATVVKFNTTIAASWLLLHFCQFLVCWCCRCERSKAAATALAAATFGACYATTVAATAVAGSFCPHHRHWLVVAFLDRFLVCNFATAPLSMMLPLRFCQWCCHCSAGCHHPFAAHCTILPLLLLCAVTAITIAAGWLFCRLLLWLLLCLIILLSQLLSFFLWHCHCLAVITFSMCRSVDDTTDVATCGYQHHHCWLPVDCYFYLAVTPSPCKSLLLATPWCQRPLTQL